MVKASRKPSRYRNPRPDWAGDWPEEPLIIAVDSQSDLSIFDKFPEHTKLLGAITGIWGTIEHMMYTLLREMMQPRGSEAAAIYFALGNHKARRDILRAVARERLSGNEALLKRVDDVLDDIGRRAARRNDLTHSTWAYFHDADIMIRIHSRDKKRQALTDESKELYEFAVSLKELALKIYGLEFEVHFYLRDLRARESDVQHPQSPPRDSQPARRTRPLRGKPPPPPSQG